MGKLSDLVRSVIIGATSALAVGAGHSGEQPADARPPSEVDQDDHIQQVDDKQKPQLVFKQSRGTALLNFAFHRSHRSHSSHRSHHSSSGSYGTTPSSTPNTTPTTPKSTSEGSMLGYPQPTTSDSTKYELGQRSLKKGMRGRDVKELEKLLVKNGYKLEPDEEFDEVTEAIVTDFQIKHGILDKGVVGPLTVFYLKRSAK